MIRSLWKILAEATLRTTTSSQDLQGREIVSPFHVFSLESAHVWMRFFNLIVSFNDAVIIRLITLQKVSAGGLASARNRA